MCVCVRLCFMFMHVDSTYMMNKDEHNILKRKHPMTLMIRETNVHLHAYSVYCMFTSVSGTRRWDEIEKCGVGLIPVQVF